MLMCLKKLQNNDIYCNNNRDISCLQFLANSHPHPNVRHAAIMNLVRCGMAGGKKRKKRKKRRTSKKKTKKRRKKRRKKKTKKRRRKKKKKTKRRR